MTRRMEFDQLNELQRGRLLALRRHQAENGCRLPSADDPVERCPDPPGWCHAVDRRYHVIKYLVVAL